MIKPSYFWLIISGLIALVLAAVFGWAKVGLNNWEAWGQFGDKFGALNTLFTGLAFVGVIAALWHERDSTADRVNEHRELIGAMHQQATAAANAIKAQTIICQVEELSSMIGKLESQGATTAINGALAQLLSARKKLHDELADLAGVPRFEPRD